MWVRVQDQAKGLARAVRHTVLTGSVILSTVIEHMRWSGTAISLASNGPAAPLLPPSAVARSNASALAVATARAAANATASPRAMDAAATRAASCAAASREPPPLHPASPPLPLTSACSASRLDAVDGHLKVQAA